MGLLDDAIREHLELKRLRGADPGDVAREERDALGPVRRDGEAEPDGPDDDETEPSRDPGSFFSGSESSQVGDSQSTGQETIEINMEAELAAGSDPDHPPDVSWPERSASVVHPAHSQAAGEESLEWEVPGDHVDKQADVEVSGKTESRVDDDHDPAEHVEDVLEETPDFLRDTPEQERLWFEQRPPRDFDFNE